MRKVLIGYDGSPCAGDAIEDLKLAGLAGEPVEALVVAAASLPPAMPATDYPQLFTQAEKAARERADAAMDEARDLAEAGRALVLKAMPTWRVAAEAVAETPYWGLVRRADEFGAELLCVGSHGRSGVGRLVFGSVSQNAVLYARCSVRVGRCRADRAPARAAGESTDGVRILLGFDGSPAATAAAAAIAARRWPAGSAVRIVSAVDDALANVALTGDAVTAGALTIGALTDGALMGAAMAGPTGDVLAPLAARAGEVAAMLRRAGLEVAEPTFPVGHARHVLVDEARRWPADCIFVGAKGMSQIERVLLGSVSAAVAARARCSVEIVRG